LFEKTQDIRVQTLPPFPPSTASVLSGQSLAPEQIVSYEAEYQGWYLQHRLRARASLFFNHISDLISTKNESPVLATSVNDGGAADIYGGEMGAELLVSKWLSGYANLSYQEIAQSLTGRVQRAAPRFKWNAGLRSEWENGLNAEVSYHYYGAVTYPMGQSFETFTALGLVQPPDPRVGSYNLLNLRGGYRFWQQKAAAGYMREAEAAISVFNALNDKHKEHPLGETIGSRVMGWLTVRF
jgi:iron complex outermembrane receptor protein